MALTIYGQAQSRTSRVLWLAKELGLQFEHVLVNQRAGETRKPDFLKINPNGHIPVIRDGDLVLWELLAINEYLIHKHGGPLAPKTNDDWGRFYMWSMWAMTEIEPHAELLYQHTPSCCRSRSATRKWQPMHANRWKLPCFVARQRARQERLSFRQRFHGSPISTWPARFEHAARQIRPRAVAQGRRMAAQLHRASRRTELGR